MISELRRTLRVEKGLYEGRIADTRAVLKTRRQELAGYKRYAQLIGDVLEGEIYLACRVNLYRLCSDKYVSGYELDGELIVQTIEPAGFEVAISELGLGLKERNFNSTRTVVDTIEMVGVARMNDGIVLPSRWARNWFRSEVLGVQPNESVTPDPRTADTPKINTPPKFFAIPPVEPALEIVEPVRKAKVLTR